VSGAAAATASERPSGLQAIAVGDQAQRSARLIAPHEDPRLLALRRGEGDPRAVGRPARHAAGNVALLEQSAVLGVHDADPPAVAVELTVRLKLGVGDASAVGAELGIARDAQREQRLFVDEVGKRHERHSAPAPGAEA
jgi:hypothetical protein